MSTCNLVELKHDSAAWDVTISRQSCEMNQPYCFTTTMTQGQAVSEAIQWTIIHLSATMSSDEISGYTDISDCKIRDILAHFNKTGGIKGSKRE